jgi:Rrf2 family protein
MNCKDRAVLSSTIAKEYGIPLEYLLKILQQLVRAGVLRSKRGPRGGFTLAKPAEEISMLEVIESVDGPMRSHLHLAELTKNAPFSMKMEDTCRKAAEQTRATYSNAKLSDMIK